MTRISVLRMAFLLAMMMTTVQGSIAELATVKHSSPVLQDWQTTLWMMIAQTLLELALITAHDILLHLTAVATAG
jgi:hypothetical protein